jgi:hypothetical protein
MRWARIQPYLKNWPGGGPPPVFEINAEENGAAVIDIAWDPQALRNPASYEDQLRFYSSGDPFSATVPKASGNGSLSISIPTQTITLAGGRAEWVMPADLWAGYVEESLKLVGGGPGTNFSGNLYYRVRVTPPAGAQATIWPADAALTGAAAAGAPHVTILPMSATIASQVVPDDAAVAAMNGFRGLLLRAIWAAAPVADPVRKSLQDVFAHATYKNLSVAERSAILTLWLFAGRSREKIPSMLSRQVVTGSNVTTPIVSKIAYKGGKSLVENLLQLVTTMPHPDLGARTREQILDDVIREILDPNGQVNQGMAGTCVPTSIQAFLINVNPAEYARLQVGWLSTTGSAELADGSTATVPPVVLQISRYSTPIGTWTPANTGFFARTFSEIAFQGAMLKFAKGGSFPTTDGSEPQNQALFKFTFENGLTMAERKKVLDALFAGNFKNSVEAVPAATTPAFATTQNNLATAFQTDFAAHPRELVLALWWGPAPRLPLPTGQSFGGHVVVPVRVEGGRVFFKNPQYAGSSPGSKVAGGTSTNPPRRYEDPSASLESMTLTDLAEWIKSYSVSDKALI